MEKASAQHPTAGDKRGLVLTTFWHLLHTIQASEQNSLYFSWERARLTCQKLFADFERINQRSEDSLNGAEHAAESEVNQHEEKHDGPEWRSRKVGHGFCEGDKGQARALDCLSGKRVRGKLLILI